MSLSPSRRDRIPIRNIAVGCTAWRPGQVTSSSSYAALRQHVDDDGMPNRAGPWKRSRRRSWRDLRFAGMTLLVAAAAFHLTLKWTAPAPAASEKPGFSPSTGSTAQVGRGELVCEVAYITDGDTLRCQDGTRIRLHAVAARESDGSCSPGHPCPAASAASATAELRRLAAYKTLRCEATGRSYNRVTAICWAPSGLEINCAMVRSGTALIWEEFDRRSPLCRP